MYSMTMSEKQRKLKIEPRIEDRIKLHHTRGGPSGGGGGMVEGVATPTTKSKKY